MDKMTVTVRARWFLRPLCLLVIAWWLLVRLVTGRDPSEAHVARVAQWIAEHAVALGC